MGAKRATLLILTVALAATLLTSCDRGRTGGRCRGSGWGYDGGAWILRCQKGRWTRALTTSDYVRLLATSAPTTAPASAPAPPPPAPPSTTTPPPRTSFGAVADAAIGHGPSLIPPGVYSTVATGQLCDIVQDDAGGAWIGRRFGTDGRMVFRVRPDAVRLTTTGPCLWAPGVPDGSPAAPNGDGIFRVGIDIAPGRYLAPGSRTNECYWETATDPDGSLAAVTDVSFSTGPQLAVIDAADAVFVTSGCGSWTPLPSLPDTYFEMITSPLAVDLRGHRAFYSGADLTLGVDASGNWDSIVAGGQDWSFTFNGPQDSRLTDGTWPTDGPWDGTGHRSILLGPGVSCFGQPGTVTVANLVRDGAGDIAAFDLLWISQCGGAFPNIVHIHQGPTVPPPP